MPATCKRALPTLLLLPPDLTPRAASFLLQPRSSVPFLSVPFHSVPFRSVPVYSYSIRSSIRPDPIFLLLLLLFRARERESDGIYYRFVRARSREREREAGPGRLSLAHLLDAIQSMRSLDLVPPPRNRAACIPREISQAAAPFIQETKTRIEPNREKREPA